MAAKRYRNPGTSLLRAIAIGLALVGAALVALGMFLNKRAGTPSESENAETLLYLGAAGLFVALLLFVVGLYWARLTATAETHGELWMRWTCPPDDAKRFLDSERQRLRVSAAMRWLIPLLGLGLGFVGVLITPQRSNPYFLFLGPLGMGALFVLLTPVMAGLEFKRSAQLVRSEIMVRSTGLFACDNYYPWRSVNWALRGVVFEPGEPAAIQFDFCMGRLANSSPPQGSIYTIRAPVPKTLEDDAKQLLGSVASMIPSRKKDD